MSNLKKTAITYLVAGIILAIFATTFGFYVTGIYEQKAEIRQEVRDLHWQKAEAYWQKADEIYKEIYQADKTNDSGPLVQRSYAIKKDSARVYSSTAWLYKSLSDLNDALVDKYTFFASLSHTLGIGLGAISLILVSKGIAILRKDRYAKLNNPA